MSRSASFPARWRKQFVRTVHGTGQDLDGIGPTAVAVGLVLCEFADWTTGGNIRPGHERVAMVVGVGTTAVKRSVAALCGAGWLTIDDRGTFGRASTYRLLIPPLVNSTTGELSVGLTGSVETPWKKAPDARNGVADDHVTGSVETHHLYQDLLGGRHALGLAA